jgi:hypothetical protein
LCEAAQRLVDGGGAARVARHLAGLANANDRNPTQAAH